MNHPVTSAVIADSLRLEPGREQALIFDIKRDCSEDGPGIRTSVFFKTCPLSCVWCQNPEGIQGRPGLYFNAMACGGPQCGYRCVPACKEMVLGPGDPLQVDFDACMLCGECFPACPSGALAAAGHRISQQDLLYTVLVDKPFYHSTGGGVTVTGGEPTFQMRFVGNFLEALKNEGIHTAIETCGYFDYERFRGQLLPHLDLVLYDIKLIDDREHRKYTGKSNQRILENFRRLVREECVTVIPRVPLIPGITTTSENLKGIAHFLQKQGVSTSFLLPYNPLWLDKAKKVGRKAEYERKSSMTPLELEACVNHFVEALDSNHRI